MKKITLLFALFCFTSSILFAQTTAIPDANFEQALIDLGVDSGSIDGLVLTNDINTITFLNVNLKNISDLTGIEDFTALEILFCTANFLTSLDVSNNSSLVSLACNNNNLNSLTLNSSLQVLNCNGNNLTSIDVSGNNALFDLDCSSNQLNSLNISSNTLLTSVDASNNQISSINLSNNNILEDLDLGTNSLTSLEVSNISSLANLDCDNNMIVSLDVSNNAMLNSLICNNNLLNSLDIKNNNNTQTSNIEFNATNNPSLFCITVDDVNYSDTTWFNIDAQAIFDLNCNATTFIPDDNFEQALIDLGYDSGPLDDFVLKFVIKAITSLDVSSKNIFDFTGINEFTSLEDLNVSLNPIQSITFDVNNLTELKTLACAFNQLTSLDVSSNTILEDLNCQTNQLTSLDVSSNPNLIVLRATNNSITSLDLINNTVLVDLRCENNQLSSLIVGNNVVLDKLFCDGNLLTSLDISANTMLTAFDCKNNQLTSLDVRNSNNPNLFSFEANSNPNLTCISVDDVTYSTSNWTNIDVQTSFSVDCNTPQTYIPNDNFEQALINLGFDTAPLNNYVPTTNISSVTTLSLQNNNISDLIGIEDFVALESFNCSFNQVTSVDMTNNTALTSLTCNNNQINSLTVNNPMLQSLVCYNNQLTSLDVSTELLLETINCSNNQISDLDISNNLALTNINCNNNQMVTLDIRNGNNPIITNQFFNITSNPNLACVFVDDVSFSSATWFNIDPTSTFVETQGECDALGVDDELLKDNLSIYPNPTRGEVTIMASNGIEVSKIEVYDVLGKKIKEMNYSSSPIDVSQLKSGVYYMSIIVNDNRVIKKLIIN